MLNDLPAPNRRRQTDYSKIDWSKSNAEIAAELRISDALVWAARRRAVARAGSAKTAPQHREKPAPKRVKRRAAPPPRPARLKMDWSAVDWSLSDDELAIAHRCSHRTVKSKRVEHAPETRPTFFRDLWEGVDWDATDESIAADLRVSLLAVQTARRRYTQNKVPARRGRPPRS